MGSTQAMGFKELVDEGSCNLDTALIWHLRSNHYPPVPLSMLEPCKLAIQLANAGDWDAMIDLPEGVTFRGSTQAPVSNMIESHHLDTFLDCDDDDYYLEDDCLEEGE